MEKYVFLNNRIEIKENDKNFRGTIKYIGKIKRNFIEDEQIWVGIEWDLIERGKNNGNIENIYYFKTKNNENYGSFLKKEKLLEIILPQFSLIEAIQDKYIEEENENEKKEEKLFIYSVKNNEIPIQLIGKEKINQQISNLFNLTKIGLSFSRINDNISNDLEKLFPS
jgi:hypothetical protein